MSTYRNEPPPGVATQQATPASSGSISQQAHAPHEEQIWGLGAVTGAGGGAGSRTAGAGGPLARARYLPGYDPDVVHEKQPDLLDIQQEVAALAALVAAEETRPPLSIGLFGNWGTGKTFFMEKVHGEVARIAAAGAPGYCSDVVQIRFNAWHYIEANLWASLIDTIFNRLEEAVLRRQDGDSQLAALRDRWQSALIRQRETEAEMAALAAKLEQAQAERDQLVAAKRLAEAEMAKAKAHFGEALPMIREEMGKQVGTLLVLARNELGMMGMPDPQEMARSSIDEVVSTLSDVRLAQSRVVQSWRAVVAGRFSLGEVIKVLLILAAPLVIAWILAAMHGESVREWLAQPFMVLGEISAMVVTATGWVRGKVRRANQVLDRIDEVRAKLIKERDAELARRDQTLMAATGRVSELGEELDSKQALLDELDAKQREAKRALDDFTPARRIAAFLSERAHSNDYRKHLGLLALIRQDLEKLSSLLALQDGAAPDESLPAVRRIVLYIDDLDRCSPQRVVELLQAIHLLLAFPLFVVIVAVDSRWVSKALQIHYPELLDHDDEGVGMQATSHDYLEKIFQVPFWIRPLTDQGSRQMIRGLLAAPVEQVGGLDEDEPALPVSFAADKLTICDHERELMIALAGMAGRSPRAIKRFINVYRLIKAGIADHEIGEFGPDEQGTGRYRPVLLALGILIGYPRIADELFDALFAGWEPPAETADSPRDIDSASGYIGVLSRRYGDSYDGPLWRTLTAEVDTICQGYPISRAELRACINIVTRYSFRIAPY